MSDQPAPDTLLGMAQLEGLRDEIASLARNTAAIMVDPQRRAAEVRPATMGRRMGVVVAVDPGPPLTADVLINGITIPGVATQMTYRPIENDLVWVEFLGPDPHLSPPLSAAYNKTWTPINLSFGWSTFSGWGIVPQWLIDAEGFMHLKGSAAGGANNTPIGVLPGGFTPPQDYSGHSVYTFQGSTYQLGNVAIAADGRILYFGPGAPTQVALDGITFSID